nr:MAG TPA: hypothetical protein [Caudoviricetes sp.]
MISTHYIQRCNILLRSAKLRRRNVKIASTIQE